MTQPFNDFVKVELDDKKYGQFASAVEQQGYEIGTVVATSPKIWFLSSFSFVLEDSFRFPEQLEQLRQFWQGKIGTKVRFEERADKGTTFEEDGRRYAMVKITKIIGTVE